MIGREEVWQVPPPLPPPPSVICNRRAHHAHNMWEYEDSSFQTVFWVQRCLVLTLLDRGTHEDGRTCWRTYGKKKTDGRTEGWTDRRSKDWLTKGRIDSRPVIRTAKRTFGLKDRQTDEQINGHTDKRTEKQEDQWIDDNRTYGEKVWQTEGRMDRLTYGQDDWQTKGRAFDGLTIKRTDRWMDGKTDLRSKGRTDERTDEWTEGRRNRRIYGSTV